MMFRRTQTPLGATLIGAPPILLHHQLQKTPTCAHKDYPRKEEEENAPLMAATHKAIRGAPSTTKGAPSEGPTRMVLNLHNNHYVVSASLGITHKTMHTLPTVVDTCSEYNVICKETLPPG